MHTILTSFILCHDNFFEVENMKKKVALVFGARSLERDISVITAMQTFQNVDKSKYVIECVFAFEGDFYAGKFDSIKKFAPFNPLEHKKVVLMKGEFYTLRKNKIAKYFKPDVVLLCCHGGEGENGVLQALFEYNSIAYTSCDVLRSASCMDKAWSKQLFESMLLNVLPYEVVSKTEFDREKAKTIAKLEDLIRYPMIVKPASLGSSIGIEVAKCSEELDFALQVASKFDEKIVVEHKLEDFVEVNCAAYSKNGRIVISDTEQPCSASDFLTFEDKYTGGKMSASAHKIPAEIGSLEDIVKSNTKTLYEKLGLSGVVRVDFLADVKRNKVYVNEINTIPGSMAFYLFKGVGISFKQLLSDIIEEAIENKSRQIKPDVFKSDVLKNFSGGGKLVK